MLYLYKQYDTKRFVFACDSKYSKRREIYPEYKANRRKVQTPEEKQDKDCYFKQVNTLRREILPELGFSNVFVQKGYEADDIIASIVQNNKKESIIIVSEDADLYQLLRDNVSMLKKKGFFTKKKFIEQYGITPAEWVEVKTLAGCTTDNIKGIPRVGEATALQYIKNTLVLNSKKYNMIRDAVVDATRKETADSSVYNLTKQLVKLPFEGTKQFPIVADKFSWEMFLKTCKHYEFESFLRGEQFGVWKRFFGQTEHSVKVTLNTKRKKT